MKLLGTTAINQNDIREDVQIIRNFRNALQPPGSKTLIFPMSIQKPEL
jgi:hypothetical protein